MCRKTPASREDASEREAHGTGTAVVEPIASRWQGFDRDTFIPVLP
jgi:hypothetical protein